MSDQQAPRTQPAAASHFPASAQTDAQPTASSTQAATSAAPVAAAAVQGAPGAPSAPSAQPRYEAPPANAPRYAAPAQGAQQPYQPQPQPQPQYQQAPQPYPPQAPQQQAYLPQAHQAQPDPPQASQPQPYAQQAPHMPSPQPGYQQAYQQAYQPPYYPQQPAYFATSTALSPAGPGGSFDGAIHSDDLSKPLYGANIAQAIARFFKSYANFKGRASRSEFWWAVLAFWSVFFVIAIIGGTLEDLSYSLPTGGYEIANFISMLLGLILFALLLGTIVPWLAISWRRLHDVNLPGPLWFINLFPYLGGIALIVLTALPPRVEGRRFDA